MSSFKQIAFLCAFQLALSGILYGQSAKPVNIKTPLVLFTDVSAFEAGEKDPILLSQISDLIGATPPGEEITVCVFKFELEALAQDLVKAQQRGVKVRVILNKGDTGYVKAGRIHDAKYIEECKLVYVHDKAFAFTAEG